MDPSDKLNFLLGTLKVKASELAPQECAVVLQACISVARQQLDHCSYFAPISHHLLPTHTGINRAHFTLSADTARKVIDKRAVSYEDGPSPSDRCLWLGELPSSSLDSRAWLMLNREGRFVVLEKTFELNVSRGRSRKRVDVVQTSRVWELSSPEEVFSDQFDDSVNGKLLGQIMERLLSSLRDAIVQRQKRLGSLNETVYQISQLISRLSA